MVVVLVVTCGLSWSLENDSGYGYLSKFVIVTFKFKS